MQFFRDRIDAGEQTAARLLDELPELTDQSPIVFALPRGGVPLGAIVARALMAPMELLVSRKLGAPSQPELGFGAVAEGGGRYVDEDTVRLLALSEAEVDAVADAEGREVARRVARYRGRRPLPELPGHAAVLVDDGIATGGTCRAAILSLRALRPDRLVLAVPVAAAQTLRELRPLVDELVCVERPESLWAIGAWYQDFSQLSDDEVLAWVHSPGPEAHAPE